MAVEEAAGVHLGIVEYQTGADGPLVQLLVGQVEQRPDIVASIKVPIVVGDLVRVCLILPGVHIRVVRRLVLITGRRGRLVRGPVVMGLGQDVWS